MNFYQSSVASTEGNPQLKSYNDKYDPSKMGEQIEKIKKDNEAKLHREGGKVEDRNIKVFNILHSN